MIYLLLEWLKEGLGWNVPAFFFFFSTRMILAAMTSLLICIVTGPYFIQWLWSMKMGQPIRKDECPLLGKLHAKKEDTPTMGGMLLLTAMLTSLALWMDVKHIFTLILALTTIVLGLMGGYDDYLKLKYKNTKGLSAKKKLLIQGGLAGGIALYLLYSPLSEALAFGEWFSVPLVKDHGAISLSDYAQRLYFPFLKDSVLTLGGVVAFLWFIFVIVGCSNAVNLTDGLDGLAAGVSIMVACCLILFAFFSNHSDLAAYFHLPYVEGSGEIAIYLAAFIGACMGFLWYNGYPAQVFMGDIGSLSLGGILGVSAVLLKRELILGLVGGIFVVEALSVIIQVVSFRYRGGKRVFLCAPLHHHFEYKGWPETKVVVRFWIVGLLLTMIGVASLKFQ
ncbi:MAG: phospho-N-acetylmuramoyl-pentapeptide-transferase [Chlamydiia bacterium]|nr:phospho-N-acetylmuramoyl-pentapeptide-transferase [Chlamydiia bacterium]